MKLLLVRHAQSHNNCVQGQVQLKLSRGVTTFEQAQVSSGGSVMTGSINPSRCYPDLSLMMNLCAG